ncbi:NAD-dependent epimerase/dehydratase family protein [Candidatus Albibeggiatoa sp. nov. NOAA]|uniref:NAD-dependent epimerase/dehydratase family protein n=1 Tax=Candidatus Albibeggiatoa sp. nov. NOAA TaxID=3162724 RepID=UPI0032FAEB2F|nr:NAD-dependent epimerase/dehydratase family protein [Thiotrichaceae bacterium]
MHTVVTGASNQIGYFLLPQLAQQHSVTAISRQMPAAHVIQDQNIQWIQQDLQTEPLTISQPFILLHLAPIWLLPHLLQALPQQHQLQHVIVFSSTSRFTKTHSPDEREQKVVKDLTEAETAIMQQCEQRQIPWTILRPTLVYGCGLDKNVAFITQFIKRFGFFPIVGQGQGLRQPVHAEDLAQACVNILQNPVTYNKAYNLSGGETLTYRQMVMRIFQQQHQPIRIIPIPSRLFKLALKLINWLPMFKHVSPTMIDRMNQDLCFEHQNAQQDFNYQPRPFLPKNNGKPA